jgi:hypothetical protein
MPTIALIFFAGWLTLVSGAAFAVDIRCSAKSGETTTALIELYTSEGCSSCPPAETWLAKSTQRHRVPEQLVPLALHVDYWNHLGWIDPYAQARFSDRQSYWAFLNKTNTIYTPQVLLNGQVLVHWQKQGDSAIPRVNAIPAQADIALDLVRHADHIAVTAEAQTRGNPGQAGLYVAVYERNLVRRIEAGENRGRTLRHDFVVRELIGPQPLEKNGAVRATPRVNIKKEWKDADLGIAAFVQVRDTGDVLQALALPLCR